MIDHARIIESRLRFLGFFVVAVSLIIVWRMFDIQVINYNHYLALAQAQQRFDKTVGAQRGKILVRDSIFEPDSYYPLAFDVKKFAVWVVPRQVKDKEKTAVELAAMTSISKQEIFDKINNDKLYIPPVKRGLNLDEANKVTDKLLPGVFVMPEYSRFYPEGALASHILGFVNNEGNGNYGVEGHYNNELKGKAGETKGEKDTLGRVITLLEQNDPQDGASYVLTIDRAVQYFVEKKLSEAIKTYEADSGTVLIMDVKTGGIVAMASIPSYDPNNFKDQAKTDASLFINPAIAHLYEPGSIFKPITMSAALDKGVVMPETTETFGETTEVQGYQIHTAEGKAFGTENMTQVLENSDNVAMVWISEKLGKEDLYKYVQKYNLLEKTGIDMDSEVAGKVPPYKQWQDINRATISFGQGISLTPLEIVSAYAAIANNGKYIYPHMVAKILLSDGTEKTIGKQEGEQIIKQETAKTVLGMLYSVVKNGHSKKAAVPGFQIGAKTGTAQISDPAGGYLKNESGLGIFNHSVAGIAPINDPQFAMLVKLEKPKTARYAESTSAPLFGEIASFLLNYHYRIAPTEPVQ